MGRAKAPTVSNNGEDSIELGKKKKVDPTQPPMVLPCQCYKYFLRLEKMAALIFFSFAFEKGARLRKNLYSQSYLAIQMEISI